MQAELASWFENGHGVGDEGMAEGKRYKYSEGTKTVGGNTVMSDGRPLSFADWRSESEGETGKKDERSKADIDRCL